MWFSNKINKDDLSLDGDDRIWDVLFNGVSLIDETEDELDFIFHSTKDEADTDEQSRSFVK
ncbi:hypothetical protein [Algibacillus agarilyticus]|uniref:hypothetical protein n=1 Tax=Algibacillus agarilyticus TaxID=2234133 RepID=UPI000DCFD6F1|nr:hypothetical protein [Algibacillus agarilyticus]